MGLWCDSQNPITPGFNGFVQNHYPEYPPLASPTSLAISVEGHSIQASLNPGKLQKIDRHRSAALNAAIWAIGLNTAGHSSTRIESEWKGLFNQRYSTCITERTVKLLILVPYPVDLTLPGTQTVAVPEVESVHATKRHRGPVHHRYP